MEFHLPILFFIFSTISLGSYADQTSSAEVYWKKMLPNTPMPKAITQSLHPKWLDNKGTSVVVGKGGVGVQTSKPHGGGTHVSVGKGGVGVETGKPHGGGTHVSVGKGGDGVETGKPYGGGTHVGVGKGGVGVSTGGKPGHAGGDTHVGVGKGGVTVVTHGKHKPVYVGVHPGASPFNYQYAATETQLHDDPTVALFFLEQDLHPGTKKTLHFPRKHEESAFIPRREADSIPFSTAKLPTILRRFAVEPESYEASVMKQTIKNCEQTDVVVAGEERYCSTSLESMVDFAVSRLGAGRSVAAVSTDAERDDGERKEFEVKGVKEVSKGGEVVACHKGKYPYAVFYCHTTKRTAAYTVELEAEGEVVEAVAVCHKDTSEWNPKHLAFQVLKVKPGSVPVCHFLPEDHLIWVRN